VECQIFCANSFSPFEACFSKRFLKKILICEFIARNSKVGPANDQRKIPLLSDISLLRLSLYSPGPRLGLCYLHTVEVTSTNLLSPSASFPERLSYLHPSFTDNSRHLGKPGERPCLLESRDVSGTIPYQNRPNLSVYACFGLNCPVSGKSFAAKK
jgi:hypothetical protein